MSTSLLVNAMNQEASKRKLDLPIEALSLSALSKRIDEASCILVAPQVRHRYAGMEASAKEAGKPIGLIDGTAYGKMDGSAVLEQALALMKSS